MLKKGVKRGKAILTVRLLKLGLNLRNINRKVDLVQLDNEADEESQLSKRKQVNIQIVKGCEECENKA